jgi:SNF2 family DNA or RNA helicase
VVFVEGKKLNEIVKIFQSVFLSDRMSKQTIQREPGEIEIEEDEIILPTFTPKTTYEPMPHQRIALEWMKKRELDNDIPGGILGLEMGLGKTITMIGLCLSNFLRRTLIVVPIVLIDQWAQQIRKTTGHNPIIYYGKNIKKINIITLLKAPIVITSYSTISISIKQINKDIFLKVVFISFCVFCGFHPYNLYIL